MGYRKGPFQDRSDSHCIWLPLGRILHLVVFLFFTLFFHSPLCKLSPVRLKKYAIACQIIHSNCTQTTKIQILSVVSVAHILHFFRAWDTCQMKSVAKNLDCSTILWAVHFKTETNLLLSAKTVNSARIWPCYKETDKWKQVYFDIPALLQQHFKCLSETGCTHYRIELSVHSFEQITLVSASWHQLWVHFREKVEILFTGVSNQWDFAATEIEKDRYSEGDDGSQANIAVINIKR